MTIDYTPYAKDVIEIESKAIQALLGRLDNNFNHACQLLHDCIGRIIVIGMGKSGHVGNKIAATLASTGTPAFFVHPAEASHGDLGMITKDDVILAISNSGTTQEIITILPVIKRLGLPLIAMTGNTSSEIAKQADVTLDISIEKEACPLNLTPTASTTVSLVLGDAIAVALLQAKGFTKKDFALSHPGGRLGKQLILRVADIMRTGNHIPKVNEDELLSSALYEISAKGLGMTAVVNNKDELVGIFTDGDLRRTLDKGFDIHNTPISKVMTKDCTTVKPDMLAIEALKLMEDKKINGFLVLDDNKKIVGTFNIHELLRSGVV